MPLINHFGWCGSLPIPVPNPHISKNEITITMTGQQLNSIIEIYNKRKNNNTFDCKTEITLTGQQLNSIMEKYKKNNK